MPDLVPSPYDAMSDIDILNGVKAHTATWPAEVLLVTRLLKEVADQLALIFWAFYRQSMGPCRIANSKRSPNLQEWWPRIFCKLQTSVSDNNLLQGYVTHNPFPDNEILQEEQDPARHTTWFHKEKFMRDAVVADSSNKRSHFIRFC